MPAARRRTVIVLGGTLVGLAVLYVAALVYLRPPSPGTEVSLDEISLQATCAGRPVTGDNADPLCTGVDDSVKEATFLDEDARIVGTAASRQDPSRTHAFWTSYPRSDADTSDLTKALINARAHVSVDHQNLKEVVHFVTQFLLPLVILADLFALLFFLIQGGSSSAADLFRFGTVRGKAEQGTDGSRTTFADVAAADEAVVELSEVGDYLADPRAFAAMGALPPKGVLLFGPPGCGKTLLARAVAGEAAAGFYSMSGSEFVEVLVGVGAARVRDLFAKARAHSPSIVFIDEIDAVGRQRGAGFGQGHDEREQTLNELLTQMDGFSASEGVVVIGATNRPDILDPALLRAGRFDRHVTLERPDVHGRLEILRLHARGRRLRSPEEDLPRVARNSPGFTGADLANLLNEAALLAVRERAASIDSHHLDEAVDRVLHGPRRRGQLLSEDEKGCIAYHEAGHAVVAAAVGKAGMVQKLSVIARGRGVGHLAVVQDDRTIFRRGDMEAQVIVAVAGWVAEEIVFGEPSTGAEQDLERATTTARDMAGRYGMSERLGLVRVLRENREVFLGRDYVSTRDVSQPTLEHLDAEVARILAEQRLAARAILHTNRSILDQLAARLVAEETLQGPRLDQLLAGVAPPPPSWDGARGPEVGMPFAAPAAPPPEPSR